MVWFLNKNKMVGRNLLYQRSFGALPAVQAVKLAPHLCRSKESKNVVKRKQFIL
jgi:hypothetical protein